MFRTTVKGCDWNLAIISIYLDFTSSTVFKFFSQEISREYDSSVAIFFFFVYQQCFFSYYFEE